MKQNTFIEGFNERLEEACGKTGMDKSKIARACGFSRKQLYRRNNYCVMNSRDVARFCAFTKTDANWLLGVKI